ncbi:unnamed protein product [Calypogeia fissa]
MLSSFLRAAILSNSKGKVVCVNVEVEIFLTQFSSSGNLNRLFIVGSNHSIQRLVPEFPHPQLRLLSDFRSSTRVRISKTPDFIHRRFDHERARSLD